MPSPIVGIDPEVAAAIDGEIVRQQQTLELIASENFVSPAILAPAGSLADIRPNQPLAASRSPSTRRRAASCPSSVPPSARSTSSASSLTCREETARPRCAVATSSSACASSTMSAE